MNMWPNQKVSYQFFFSTRRRLGPRVGRMGPWTSVRMREVWPPALFA